MHITFATSEVFPYSKTGGLADVSAALPRELSRLGHDVVIFTPLYRQTASYLKSHGVSTSRLRAESVWIGDEQHELSYQTATDGDLTMVFVDNPHYFDRDGLYSDPDKEEWSDNVPRFSYFCQAVLAYLREREFIPDVIHCNDWQTALIPVHLSEAAADDRLANVPTVLTIHNLGYQGVFPPEQIYATGVGWDHFHMEELEFHGKLNLLKGGIAAADRLTTVSPTYAKEIRTEDFGHGLDGFLEKHGSKLTGILNGIDETVWDPSTDNLIASNFSAKSLTGKAKCKADLQTAVGLPRDASTFLLGVVSRMDRQKGMHLIVDTFSRLASTGAQLVVLGSGAGDIEAQFLRLAEKHPRQVAFLNRYDETLAHRIEAGADAFLMPSLYEPCGLNQMYSQRYGTVPIVREVGGLKDTVLNFTPRRLEQGKASGFSFRKFDTASLLKSLRAAHKLFTTDRKSWDKLVRHIMQIDHSWDQRSGQYVELYTELLSAMAKERSANG